MRRLSSLLALAALVSGVTPSPARAYEPTEDEIERAQKHMRSAYAWVRSNKLPAASREYRKALDLVPGNADLLYNLVSLSSAQKACSDVLLYGSAFAGVAGRTKEMGEVRKMMDRCEGDVEGGAGRIEITGAPMRADVWVDGVLVGKAPLKPLAVVTGEHTVRVSADDHQDWSGSVTVEQKQTTAVEAKPTAIVYTGYLTVKTTPADGVRVYVDERLVGTTPMERVALDTGKHLVRFELVGWDRWVRYVTIEKEATEDLEATLEQTEEGGHLTDAQD